jgi:hypothetical protein
MNGRALTVWLWRFAIQGETYRDSPQVHCEGWACLCEFMSWKGHGRTLRDDADRKAETVTLAPQPGALQGSMSASARAWTVCGADPSARLLTST